MTRITRRALLCGLSLSAGVGALSVASLKRSRSTSGTGSTDEHDFDPRVDAFGFDNYATPPVPPEPTEFVSRRDLREELTGRLETPLGTRVTDTLQASSGPRLRTIVDDLYANANRLFGTKGYCYGMVAAAQWYCEEPTAVPLERDSASEIEHVNEPLENDAAAPVRDDIERFHRQQFLDAESWLRRWALLDPDWIDYETQERHLRAAIDEFGSAGITISGADVLNGHYVLLYDYDANDDDVVFAVYDPNDAADRYVSDDPPVVGIETATHEPLLGSYAGTYDRFLFIPADRTISARGRVDR
jgi:hypothetical protein